MGLTFFFEEGQGEGIGYVRASQKIVARYGSSAYSKNPSLRVREGGRTLLFLWAAGRRHREYEEKR